MWGVCWRSRDDSGLIWNVASDVELSGRMVGVLSVGVNWEWVRLIMHRHTSGGAKA